MNPRWPVFIPSKGRWTQPLTARAFDQLGIPYSIVVQPRQEAEYRSANLKGEMLLLPDGLDGLVPTRNWIWDRAAEMGVERFWTFDDNIRGLWRLHDNRKISVGDGTPLRILEDWAERWDNLAIAGMNYYMFAPRKAKVPGLNLNTRVYSNMLILTDARDSFGKPYRNEGVYNDDTDLCLRVLKDGWCTALFNAFLVWKTTTMLIKGGMTPQYQGDGRLKMATELWAKHPDVTRITRRWDRWQHYVDYSKFAGNRLRLREGVELPTGTNEYGLELLTREKRTPVRTQTAERRTGLTVKQAGPPEKPRRRINQMDLYG